MRSFIAAAVLSIVIIITGVMSGKKLQNISDSLYDETDVLYSYLKEDNKEKATHALKEAEKSFKSKKVILEATSNHEEILRIELAYGHIREFIETDQMGDALASCGEIKQLIRHLPSNFKLKAENIL